MFRALDLFCGAGGASMGLHRAGFDVTGIDIKKQPRYPFRFIQADALNPPFDLAEFDLIWASPPCQAYTSAAGKERNRGKVYPDLIAPVRRMLAKSGVPFVIENVPRAPLRPDLKLHGDMFPDLRVVRERWFELSWDGFQLCSKPRVGVVASGEYLSVAGNGTQGWCFKLGHRYLAKDCKAAMGIDWMDRKMLSQAIPPAYAEFIGRAALRHLTPSPPTTPQVAPP
jgi:DNA (cytosine-5)-methyltransferase 1